MQPGVEVQQEDIITPTTLTVEEWAKRCLLSASWAMLH